MSRESRGVVLRSGLGEGILPFPLLALSFGGIVDLVHLSEPPPQSQGYHRGRVVAGHLFGRFDGRSIRGPMGKKTKSCFRTG